MSDIREITKGSVNPLRAVATGVYKARNFFNDPNYFYPAGIWVFCGPQGSGKTLSAVSALQSLVRRYPAARVISNMAVTLPDGRDYEPWTGYEQLTTESNGTHGIIFFLDEIHVLWNSLESKNIPISEMAAFCQMRKDRRVIIGTSQVYGRIAKPIREQLQYVVACRNYFSLLQVNHVLDPQQTTEKDGKLCAPEICTRWWFHTPGLYDSYDTLLKIRRTERNKRGGVRRG